jgi:TPR repeat protein
MFGRLGRGVALGALSGVLSACATDAGGGAVAPAPVVASAEPQRCDDALGCDRVCQAGNAEACKRAWTLLRDEPLAADVAKTVDVFARACEAGEPRACKELATVLDGAPDLPDDPAPGRRARARACDLGDSVQCFVLATTGAEMSAEVLRDVAPILERGCEGGDGNACMLLGGLQADRERRAQLFSRAFVLLEERCLAGGRDECERASDAIALSAGVLTLQGPGGRLRWTQLFRRGCELGSSDSCLELAGFDGSETPAQMLASESLDLLERACSQSSAVGCLLVAKAHGAHGAEGAARGDARAREATARGVALARRGCELGDARDCKTLTLSLPLLGASAAEEIVSWIAPACERPSPSTCSDLADGLAAWPQLTAGPSFVALKRRACLGGYKLACPDPMRAMGVYVPIDAAIVDARGRLEWAPPAAEPAPPAAERVAAACPKGSRLPTEEDLATLLAADGAVREFIRDTTPKRTALAAASKKGSFDLEHGRFELAAAAAVERCVRALSKGAKPAEPTLRLRAIGADLEASLRPSSGNPTTTRSAEEALWLQLPQREAGGGTTLEIVAEPGVAWPLVARVVAEARKQGWIVRRIWID